MGSMMNRKRIVPSASSSASPRLRVRSLAGAMLAVVALAGCGSKAGSYRVYVTNEASGDLTIIDPVKMEAIATLPLGKRALGIHPTPDGKYLLVALSGSPLAP